MQRVRWCRRGLVYNRCIHAVSQAESRSAVVVVVGGSVSSLAHHILDSVPTFQPTKLIRVIVTTRVVVSVVGDGEERGVQGRRGHGPCN